MHGVLMTSHILAAMRVATRVKYHRAGNNQGLGNTLIEPDEAVEHGDGETVCRNRLSGMLLFYCRQTAGTAAITIMFGRRNVSVTHV